MSKTIENCTCLTAKFYKVYSLSCLRSSQYHSSMANHYTDSYASYQSDTHPSSTDFSHLNSIRGKPLMLSQLVMSKDNGVLDTDQNSFNVMTPSSSSLGAPASTEGPGSSSSPSFRLPDMLDVVHPASNQIRKPRKDKPRIDLAPDQPPTTQGRERARVFVACFQWYATSPHRDLIVVLICFSIAEPARSVVTVQSQNASTAFSVKGTTSVLTILYRNVVGLTRPRERVLVAHGRRMMVNLPRGAGVAVPRLSIKLSIKPLVDFMTSRGQALPSSPRSPIP